MTTATAATKAMPGTTASPFTPQQERELTAWAERYPHRQMGLVEALRAVQEWKRCVGLDEQRWVATLFGLPLAWVHATATFFPMFTETPTGRHRIGICQGLSCWLAGGDKMKACLAKTFGLAAHETSADGRVSWEPMECLGACEQAPALQVNDRLQGAATEAMIERLARDLK